MTRVTKDGKTLTERVWLILEDAKKEAGLEPTDARVVQGSYSNGSLSAGTHSGGGAFDLSVRGLTVQQQWKLIRKLRERNVCAWARTERYGWKTGDHIHGIVRDEPDLSASARAQVVAYDKGLNGLANKGKDPHARPVQRPIEEVLGMAAWKIGRQKMVKPGKTLTIKGGRWVTLAKIYLPKNARYANTLQFRMPRGVKMGEARLARLGWGGDSSNGSNDYTAHDAIAPASVIQRWRTPIKGHDIEGGGPLAFQVYLPAGTHKIRFVAKAKRTS